MKTIVVTGSTRGIGFGLADAFLTLGCNVVLSGRTKDAVDRAVDELASRHEAERIRWLTQWKVLARFLSARFHKRDVFRET